MMISLFARIQKEKKKNLNGLSNSGFHCSYVGWLSLKMKGDGGGSGVWGLWQEQRAELDS